MRAVPTDLFFPLFMGSLLIPAANLPLTAQPTRLAATIQTRIGAVDGPSALGRVEAVTGDRFGHVYVLESDEHRVRVFDGDGRLLHALGRSGSGPGELAEPVGLAWAPDSTLWIMDPGNARASVYDSQGNWISDQRVPSSFTLVPWPGRFDRGGYLYHYAPRGNDDGFGYVMVKYDAELIPLDTLVPPAAPEPVQFFETRTERWGTVRAAVPFAPQLLWRIASDGRMWWAWTARYAIFSDVDEQDAVITAPHSGPRVTREEHAAALERLQRFREVGGRIEPSRIPDRKPPLRTFFLDDADNVWVMPELAAGETGRRLDWYDENGSLRGHVDLPVQLGSAPPPVVRGGLLYGVEREEFDVPYVVVLRLPE